MKRIVTAFACLLMFSGLSAQIHEVGVFGGGTNFIGDVGPTNYIKPNDLALGLYKWNKSPRHSWRFSYIHADLKSDDADSDAANRNQRGYKFKNSVDELTAGLEFNFMEFDLHELKRQITPYVFTGLSYFRYTSLYVLNNETEKDGKNNALAIPMVVGVKSNITPKLIIGFEIGARYTFVDDIDGSTPDNPDYSSLEPIFMDRFR